jgi:cytochrome oxidase Cu insertion factor (SCO1/SenC/PrrC family)
MKLFYHFLFFVFASIILLACANMFASDSQKSSQADEFPSPEPGNTALGDVALNATPDNPFTLTSFKNNAPIISVSNCVEDKNCACKKNSYLSSFQMAINHFSPSKGLR